MPLARSAVVLSIDHSSAARIWTFFREETKKVVTEVGEVLGRHLREMPFAAREIAGASDRGALEIFAGRTRLLLECPLILRVPEPHERVIAEMFGDETPVVRLYVRRNGTPESSWIAADPVSDRWASGRPDLGPVPFSDRLALETLLLSLLVDSGS